MSAPPLALVVIIRVLGLGVAAVGWVFGVIVCVVALPLLPMIASGPGVMLWAVSLILTPVFGFFAARRFGDVSLNGIVDPILAGGPGAFCGWIALAILQRVASLEIA